MAIAQEYKNNQMKWNTHTPETDPTSLYFFKNANLICDEGFITHQW